MKDINVRIAGALIILGILEFFIFGLLVSEAIYPNFSVANNYISDLGVGTTAPIFNASVIILGIMQVSAAYFIRHGNKTGLFSLLLAISGVGAMGVGTFPEASLGNLHLIFSFIAFFFGALAIISSYPLASSPFSYLSLFLGAASLAAMVLFGSGNYLGLGRGGMENMILQPLLVWGLALGGYLTARSNPHG